MSFRITARTILQLGAELISSDEVALYELIKNAIDARSKSGVSIDFQICMLRSSYDELSMECRKREADKSFTAELFRKEIVGKLVADAPTGLLAQFTDALDGTTPQTLLAQLDDAYTRFNCIVVTDTGHGMSASDLDDIFLTIGTTSRAAATRSELAEPNKAGNRPTYLGEKGVGRLSAMRLGSKLRVESATEADAKTNVLEIDWDEFERAYDKPYDSVKLEAHSGEAKKPGYVSGTTLTICGLRSVWTPKVLKHTVETQLSKLFDPFSFVERRRAQVRLVYNGKALEYGRNVSDALLKSAHAKCIGHYQVIDGTPNLHVEMEVPLFNGSTKPETFDLTDLKGMSGIVELGLPSSALSSIGPFSFELYWYNRQRLTAVPDVGDRAQVQALVRQWTGIFLFRDGYRVLPYGNEGDDWLMLDRAALGSPGYKLNTKQFIGRVRIGRLTNPRLLDQTNRQGLQACPETSVLVETLHNVISGKLKAYIDECMAAEKRLHGIEFDKAVTDHKVEQLERRTKDSIKVIRQHYRGPEQVLQQIKDAFAELNDAYSRAVSRVDDLENEKERMLHLAGVGLLVETVAHELTRATEHTQDTLKRIKADDVSAELGHTFTSLRAQLATITKRLRILEPLSVSARNRRSHQDLVKIVRFVLGSHEAQFDRHGIITEIRLPGGKQTTIDAFVVEGMVVQILENLIANSVYWLKLHKEDHRSHKSRIVVELTQNPPTIVYFDNGPGIPTSRREAVFEPFFSTKGKAGRHGLGLYIARQNAELMKGTIGLVDEPQVHKGRLNAFSLELREGADEK
jgi:signal transduction histidine kinase